MASLALRQVGSGGYAAPAYAGPLGDGWVPMRFVIDSGERPIVAAAIDGVEVRMLVHANAGFHAMLTHEALLAVTGGRVAKETDFGLGHDLKLSAAGRGHTTISSLAVGGSEQREVRFEVFDLPTTNWDGMLGLDWLASAGVVVDVGRRALHAGPWGDVDRSASAVPHDAAVTVPLVRDSDTGRFLAELGVETGGDATAGRFVASTVAETTLDIDSARALGVDLGDPVDEEHGPGGAVVPVYAPAAPITLTSAGTPIASVRPTVYDVYGYSRSKRPAEPVAGYLGADLLLDHGAVLDFGGRRGKTRRTRANS